MAIDLSGQKFGKWTVLHKDNDHKGKNVKWVCQCGCGVINSVQYSNLVSGGSTKCRVCHGNVPAELIGQQFGKWFVLSKGKKKRTWLCRCECGKECEVLGYHLLSGNSTKCTKCANREPIILEIGAKYGNVTVLRNYDIDGNYFTEVRCDCGRIMEKVKAWYLLHNKKQRCRYCAGWEGYKEISGSWWSGQRRSAYQRGLEFELTIEFVWELYLKQDKKCALSGVQIKFDRTPSRNCRPQTVSIDRINSDIGYVNDNIQLVHKKINFLKHSNTQNELILMCNLIAKQHLIKSLPTILEYETNCI